MTMNKLEPPKCPCCGAELSAAQAKVIAASVLRDPKVREAISSAVLGSLDLDLLMAEFQEDRQEWSTVL